MFDILIKNATVVDGTGAPRFTADIAVKDGLIADIAPNLTGEAKETIDACGKVVTPGFIDYHSHSDSAFIYGTDAYNYLEQGVTTQITGHCGSGPVPYYEGLLDDSKRFLPADEWQKVRDFCDDFKTFTDHVKTMQLGTNMAFYAAQGNIRGRVINYRADAPTDDEMKQMEALMAQAMECGFLGFTTGLVYAPSVYAGTEELVNIARVAARYGGSYTSHIRGEGNTVVQSVEEAIEIGRRTGIPVVISHLKVLGKKNEGLSEKVIEVIERANREGVYVRADQYPFTAGSAPLVSQIPPKYLTEGVAALMDKLTDSALRERIRYSVFNEYDEFESGFYQAGYEGCLIAESAMTPEHVGKTLAQLGEEWGCDGLDAACRLLRENNGFVQGIYFSQNESDMLRIISHPYVMGGSDWSDYAEHFARDKVAGGHPRGTGTFTRRIEILRDKNLRTMEEIIHSMTGLPAEVSRLPGIGVLKVGNRADLCILDYENVRCNADFTHPFKKNDGVEIVLVGGAVAVRNGEATGVKNGSFLHR